MIINFPNQLVQGDSFTFKTTINKDYHPSLGYELHLAIRGLNSADIVATVEAGEYVLTLTSSVTSTLTPGVYKAIFYVIRGIERITIQQHELDVLDDPIQLSNIDLRSHEEIMLDAIEAFMENRATKGQLDHILTTIDGKSLQRMTMTELLQLRDHYKNKVMTLKNKAPKRYLYRFVR